MIQRIQSIYLLLAGILTLLPVLLSIDFATLSTENGLIHLTSMQAYLSTDEGVEVQFSSVAILVSILLNSALIFYSIFQFRNRKLQVRLVQGGLLLQSVIAALVLFYADKLEALSSSAQVEYNPMLSVFLTNVILLFLAVRGIRKDEALVRSADRLR